MSQNIIMRPAYNRPEMLQLSIEYEVEARKTAQIKDGEYITFFLIEYGAPKEIIDIIQAYPYPSVCQFRKRWWRLPKRRKYGITRNLLEGMKEGFKVAEHYCIVIEDDILIHKTYFQYINAILSLPEAQNFSAICSVSPSNTGNLSIVHKGNDYSPWASLLSKKFWINYIKPYSNEFYYSNRTKTVIGINNKYKKHQNNTYKFGKIKKFDNHDGLINRLVDAAMIEQKMFVIIPEIDRQIHIGVYGTNTPGKIIPGNTFEERIQTLKNFISSNKLSELTESTIISFKHFSPLLDVFQKPIVLD